MVKNQNQGKNQGLLQNQGLSKNQHQSQDQSQNQGQGQNRDQNQNQAQGQDKNQYKGCDLSQDQNYIATKLLTEVACCIIDINGKVTEDVQLCENAVSYLSKDDPALLKDFEERTGKVKEYDGSKPYVGDVYIQMPDNQRRVIWILKNLTKDPDIPMEQVEMLSKVSRLITDFYDVENRNSIYFITEQACCLIQAQGKESKDLKICEQAIRFLVKGDPELLQEFKERTNAMSHDPEADYNVEEYDGKRVDVYNAITDLMNLAKAPDTAAKQGEMLQQAAQMIEKFYGMEIV